MQEDGTLVFSVAPEVEALRGRRVEASSHQGLLDLDGIAGDALEICAAFASDAPGDVGIRVRCSPDGSEETIVWWDASSRSLTLDTVNSSLDPDAFGEVATAVLDIESGDPLYLRVFVDHSVVEVYANDRIAISGRVYPSRPDSLEVRVVDTDALCGPIQCYEMTPSNNR
jgi:sucrose-6-phosphate hydrolase SacC (GH32 family)